MQNTHRRFLLFDTCVPIFFRACKIHGKELERARSRVGHSLSLCFTQVCLSIPVFCAAFAREYRGITCHLERGGHHLYICTGIERNPISRMRKTRPTSLFRPRVSRAIYGTSPSIVRHLRSDRIARRDHSIDRFPFVSCSKRRAGNAIVREDRRKIHAQLWLQNILFSVTIERNKCDNQWKHRRRIIKKIGK